MKRRRLSLRPAVLAPILSSAFLAILPLLLAACGATEETGSPAESPAATAPAPQAGEELAHESPASQPQRSVVVFLGDSLTAGFGLSEEQAFPALIGEELKRQGLDIEVVNAGVSGDTSAGGLARLDWVLRAEPQVLVVELGGNDALRGQPLDATEANLRQILRRGKGAGAQVLLVGMQLPPNYGPEYTRSFRELYPRLAEELSVPLVPFLLEGVGGDPELNLPDGLHPNPEGHRRVAQTVLPYVRRLLEAEGG